MSEPKIICISLSGKEEEASGIEAISTLMTLTPDRSLLPVEAEHFSHDALAREAAGHERLGCWDTAAAFWEAATREALGENLAWCQARMAWCLRRARETLAATEQMMPLTLAGEMSWS